MPICEKRKLAFCHIPRTGGVSVVNSLDMKVVDRHYPVSWYRINYPGYKVFTTIRSYDDRIRSALGWKIPDVRRHQGNTLDEVVESIKSDNGKISLMLKDNDYFLDEPADYYLRFEHLQEDLNKMLKELGHDPVLLVKVNSFR